MKKNVRNLIGVLLLMGSTASAAGTGGPWNLDALFQTPKWEQTELAPKPGMTGLLYDSIPFAGNPVQVFAYYAAPKGDAPKGGWPAVVCIHGGGGTAFEFWVQKWNKKGYAAISMDLEGHLPLSADKRKSGRKPTPNPGPSRVGVFDDFDKPVDQQWYYHAVAQTLLAHSLLRSFPEVNPEKTGVTGISWGGTLTSTVMGVDSRFKFAIPGYGCGFLSDSSGHQGRAISPGKHKETVDTYYDGSAYFQNVTMPTLWVNGMNDFHFDMPAMQKSAQAVKGPAVMRFELGMKHGHGPVIHTEECYVFADSVVNGGAPLPALDQPFAEGDVAEIEYTSAVEVKGAELLYTTDAESIWPDKEWHSLPATLGKTAVTATLPAGTFAFCFAVTDERNAMVSSEFLQYSVAGGEADDASAAQSEKIDFDALFKQVVESPGATVLIADDFENGISEPVRQILKLNDPAGTAGIVEWYDEVASGGKSLRMKNSSTVEYPHEPNLSLWLRGRKAITNGTITIAFDLFTPSEGGCLFGVSARDYTVKPPKPHLSMTCGAKGTKVNGGTLKGSKDHWVHYTVRLPVGGKGQTVTVSTTDGRFGNRDIQTPILKDECKAISWIGLLLPGKSEGCVYLDNLAIIVED